MTLMTRDSRSKHYLGHFDEDEVPIWPCDQFSRPYIREEPFSYSTQSGSYWFEQRFFEMERRFAEFMKNIDQRFTGMLGVVDVNSNSSRSIPVIHEEIKSNKHNRMKHETKKYKIKVNVQDFKPEEVTVQVSNGEVQVQAKRETKNEDIGMYAHTYREFRRIFSLPDGVKTENVFSSLTNDGILMIEATNSSTPTFKAIPIVVVHESGLDNS